MFKFFRHYALYFAWLIALTCLLGSLYSSEILKMPVCLLCWYQRIALYPLALILGIATYRDDRAVIHYALPLSLLAMLIALYQYLMQMFPTLFPLQLCGLGPSCYAMHFKLLGFITYPFLSLLTAVLITAFIVLASCQSKR
jgi:disulfide bond formation protein DsbB